VRSGAQISWATSDGTRRSMQANKSRDTKPELAVLRLLDAAGLRYRVNHPVLPRRTADIVLTRAKVAVFIDGCFWHGCPAHYQPPSTNRDYWHEKVVRNSERDADTTARLLGSRLDPVALLEARAARGRRRSRSLTGSAAFLASPATQSRSFRKHAWFDKSAVASGLARSGPQTDLTRDNSSRARSR